MSWKGPQEAQARPREQAGDPGDPQALDDCNSRSTVMNPITRRSFLSSSMAAGLVLGKPGRANSLERFRGPNETVNLAVVGLGDTTAKGGVGGRGHQLISRIRELPGVRIVALCDVDQTFLDRERSALKDREPAVATYKDIRQVLDEKTVDAVVIALPNHWHALATVWAAQAGKDVYVEKPFSHDLWEGQQMVAAARKYGRIVQVGTQNRSSTVLSQAFHDLRSGQIGAIRYAHALVYRARDGIGRVDAPTPPPGSVDYDLWCGPAPKTPLMRKQLHYEWHWFWSTGNGEMGNNGIHEIDICRWALGHEQTPPRALSIGGRFAFHDCGETANTQIALLDYQPAPLICEIRNVKVAKGASPLGRFRGQNHGIVIDCEGGYFAGDAAGGVIFDRKGRKIKEVPDDGSYRMLEAAHLSNFADAVRSRKSSDLAAEALQGHISTACCHMANVSHRLGKESSPAAVRSTIEGNPELTDAFDRCRKYLRENGVDLDSDRPVVGPWVTFDPKDERFVGGFAEAANKLSRREYRKPFVVPEVI
jgi:predicted dehydrogenase